MRLITSGGRRGLSPLSAAPLAQAGDAASYPGPIRAQQTKGVGTARPAVPTPFVPVQFFLSSPCLNLINTPKRRVFCPLDGPMFPYTLLGFPQKTACQRPSSLAPGYIASIEAGLSGSPLFRACSCPPIRTSHPGWGSGIFPAGSGCTLPLGESAGILPDESADRPPAPSAWS